MFPLSRPLQVLWRYVLRVVVANRIATNSKSHDSDFTSAMHCSTRLGYAMSVSVPTQSPSRFRGSDPATTERSE